MYYLAEEEQKAAMEVIKSGALFRYWSPDSKVAAFEAAVCGVGRNILTRSLLA